MWDLVACVLKAAYQPACSRMAGSYRIVALYNALALTNPRPHLYPGENGRRGVGGMSSVHLAGP